MVDDADAVAQPLGLVHVVRGQQHRAPALLEAARRRPRAAGATADRGRSSARRGRAARGRPTSAHATARRCFCPPDSFSNQASRFSSSDTARSTSSGARPRAKKERKSVSDLAARSACSGRCVSCSDTPSRSRRARSSVAQRMPRTSTSPRRRVEQPLEDLDRRRLAGAVGPEQAEALARAPPRGRARRRRARRRRSASRGRGTGPRRRPSSPWSRRYHAPRGLAKALPLAARRDVKKPGWSVRCSLRSSCRSAGWARSLATRGAARRPMLASPLGSFGRFGAPPPLPTHSASASGDARGVRAPAISHHVSLAAILCSSPPTTCPSTASIVRRSTRPRRSSTPPGRLLPGPP